MSQYLGSNGYTYEKNDDGSFSRSGTARPDGMSAAEQYDAANDGAFSSYSRNSAGDVSAFAGTYGRFSVSSDRANLFDGSPGKPAKSAGTGAASGGVSTGSAANHSTGPGNAGVSTSGVRVPGPGGSSLQLPVGKLSGVTPLVFGGQRLPLDTGASDINEWEQRYGDSEIGNPTWFASWGVFSSDLLRGLTVDTGKVSRDFVGAPGWVADGATEFAAFLDAQKASIAASSEPSWLDQLKPGRLTASGDIRVTGGGF